MIRIRSIVPPLDSVPLLGDRLIARRLSRTTAAQATTPLAAARHRRGPLLAKTRDAIGMQLGIVDRPAFLADAIGTEAAVRVYHGLITLAAAYVLLRRPIARPIARISLRTIGHHHGPARAHLRASDRYGRDHRHECR